MIWGLGGTCDPRACGRVRVPAARRCGLRHTSLSVPLGTLWTEAQLAGASVKRRSP